MARQQFLRRDEDDDARIDWGIIFSVLVLAVIGMISLYVALTHDMSTTSVTRTMITQAMWYVLGIGAVIFIMQFDAEQLWKIAPLAYGIGIFLLILVLFFYSRRMAYLNGAKSWFAIGSLSFQPSEVMKPAFILMMGRVISQHNSEYPEHTTRSDWLLLGKLFAWTIPVAVLLKLQNDFGTMLVFFAILGGMILVSGITWKIIAPVAGAVTVLGSLAIFLVVYDRTLLEKIGFQAYQFKRIDSWLDPSGSTSGSSYQLWQSMKAIGSGQLLGKGFNVSNVYVPVRQSDMIFSVIGENFGFIGCCLLIFIYLLLIFQMIQVTFDTKNEFYAYISTGVIMMILFHVFENIGMNIGLLPLTGIPLPFVSQGGSALIGNMIGIGFVMSMRYHNKSYMFSNGTDFR
ncbi:FtsW/RodA/SpoVE family cell cycle protein [Ligilactobacillus murinus]|uniref:Rod shape-determining protein RodA n=1 Tax=Ligilactobacillus murinus TaxID=1622 RepID=A0A2Z4W062_9LACO|nr:FtsW/RodA/SpoVE family cell cycle protein [Ligilactobacillus murinus]HCM78926.1 rod shape-determining protein RodA [Lactobacillus sp.]AWZ38374.1 rod shape-determining protein RodA [Ligilactobacillus murinus]AWZ40637.1 rod shape-determining protein RodA [Ligilactobacillus murinus]MCR1896274.1 rod shape-determining protein RodA [Ligilactobacillus murinus]TGY52218.1 rod shape-determining protein RodA [Ligilactobacillus murinus]